MSLYNLAILGQTVFDIFEELIQIARNAFQAFCLKLWNVGLGCTGEVLQPQPHIMQIDCVWENLQEAHQLVGRQNAAALEFDPKPSEAAFSTVFSL